MINIDSVEEARLRLEAYQAKGYVVIYPEYKKDIRTILDFLELLLGGDDDEEVS